MTIDVKEYYFYLDSTPTHSYLKFLYKYPQAGFPYDRLVDENRQRDKTWPGGWILTTQRTAAGLVRCGRHGSWRWCAGPTC